ncbi:hypothetical protein MM440_11795 [Arsenicicoccus piscis]|uniref:Uncharacterized protein n=1 Tax=Arsenicicoccus piscis TaxID=673954 RepID=A0ABQ6HNU4_9MICO|nr:hypothetical protein [Arsenicicoccus piscis]MCH8628433.1 hypothetical protein [Arsenicicoccus piscis]GMA20007.1 hypothetical protein GCM10025862_20280 [Arsenicicoccus piscis]
MPLFRRSSDRRRSSHQPGAPKPDRLPRLTKAQRLLLCLRDGDRVLGHDVAKDGAVLVAGLHTVSLLAPTVLGEPADHLVDQAPWHVVERGSWSASLGRLVITFVDGRPDLSVELQPTSPVLATVRERVQASVIMHQDVKVRGGTARVVLRQDLARSAPFVQTVYGQGVEAQDPAVAGSVEAAAAELRESIGLARA